MVACAAGCSAVVQLLLQNRNVRLDLGVQNAVRTVHVPGLHCSVFA